MLAQTVPIPQDWVRGLKFSLFSYNISPHASTGESPFFLLFCRDANFPSEVDEALLPTPYSVDIDDFRAIMMQNLGDAVQNVGNALEKEQIDDALELSLQTVEISDRIVLRDARPGREASTYESDEKKVVLVALIDDSGLGPYSVCSGTCTSRCKPVHVSDVLQSYGGVEAKQVVPTLAHQVFLVELGKYLDEAELPAKVTILLGKSADLLNREFADLVGGRPVTAPSRELIQAQAYLRKARCHRVQVSLAHNTSVPIRVFGDNHDDHRYFTSSVYSSGTASHPHIGADVLGPIWERVRNGSGRNVVSGPFLALCPPGDEPMFRSDIVRI
ncbi:polyprotein of retroviral origin, partial [Aphelenchoides avenae]